jgi:predicted nucleic-acid-binding Zn-ribbon protein
MMTQCPECGSTEIVSDLQVFSDEAATGQQPPYVKLLEPEPAKRPYIWVPKSVVAGFRAAVCGGCGYTHFYTRHFASILQAHKHGYKTAESVLNVVPM